MSEIPKQASFCSNCGAVVPDNSLFCPNCGKQQQDYTIAAPLPPQVQEEAFNVPAPTQPSYAPPAYSNSAPQQNNQRAIPRKATSPGQGRPRFLALSIAMIALRVIAWIVMAGGWLSIVLAIIASITGAAFLSSQASFPRELSGLTGLGAIFLIPTLLIPPIAAFPFFAAAEYLDLFISIEANQRAQIALMSTR